MVNWQVWQQWLHVQHGYVPVLATELEFYLLGAEDIAPETVQVQCCDALTLLPVAEVSAESGPGQYEVALLPVASFGEAVQNLVQLKQTLRQWAEDQNWQVTFAAKPKPEAPGSGLHVHMHLNDVHGNSVYYKQGAAMSEALRWSLGGLLMSLPAALYHVAPDDASYARFVAGGNAPLTASWGMNNRTVALRLPARAVHNRPIECRVAGADAPEEAALGIVLAGAAMGLDGKIEPPEPIYGDAALPMYRAPALPHTRQEAAQRWKGSALQSYLCSRMHGAATV